MSLLPSLTQSSPGVPIFAPATGGGGGGVSPDLTLSTLTLNTADSGINFPVGASSFQMLYDSVLDNNNSTINTISFELDTPGVTEGLGVAVGGLYIQGTNAGAFTNPSASLNLVSGNLTVQAATTSNIYMLSPTSISSLTVSSINGASPGGGGGAAVSTFTDLTVSSGSVALGGTIRLFGDDTNLYKFLVNDSNISTVATMSLGTVGGRNQLYADVGEIPAFYTSTISGTTGVIQLNPTGTEQIRIGATGAPGDITLNTVGGGQIVLNGAASAPITASISSLTVSSINGASPSGGGAPNLTLSTLNLNGGANQINMSSDNTAVAKLWATGTGGLNISSCSILNEGNPVTTATVPFDRPIIQAGFCQSVPYTSTILFPAPYNSDKVAVMVTPTNSNVSPGQNPSLSLAQAFGTNGVSSIGFAVDARNGGVGYAADFYWMSFSWT